MSDFNTPESMRKRAELLDELKALQATLHLENRLDPSKIPLLEEVIEEEVETIADIAPVSAPQDAAPNSPPSHSATASGQPYRESDNFDREIFLQQVIDAMMPEIEAELRRRMLALDEEILYRWYQQHLGDS
ncbi:hypothetical protein NCG89_15395 [Spongiibacter taiwanensis]|uniref:hypothetical protein n=1 Tax=Spongiibacter taiwanensis TaxID=1748242 RepID=UPI002034D09A|nr:hypothetical protein [Spongiibacter taiwanensis]USA42910.1 hypothetical protein NCG89_15395 [Spongiibacter taiwanensis]